MMHRRWKRFVVFLMIVGWMTLIFNMSAQSGEVSGALSRVITEPLTRLLARLSGDMTANRAGALYSGVDELVRNAAHFFEYAVLGGLLMLLFQCMQIRRMWLPWLVGVIYAATDEWHQSFIPGRVCDANDLIIDALGVLAGAAVCKLIINWRRKQHVYDS